MSKHNQNTQPKIGCGLRSDFVWTNISLYLECKPIRTCQCDCFTFILAIDKQLTHTHIGVHILSIATVTSIVIGQMLKNQTRYHNNGVSDCDAELRTKVEYQLAVPTCLNANDFYNWNNSPNENGQFLGPSTRHAIYCFIVEYIHSLLNGIQVLKTNEININPKSS